MKLFKVFFFVLLSVTFAQALSSEWKPVYMDDESTFYLNSSKIIAYGNEISVWAIEEFNTPQKTENGESVKKIKTHYLFNKMKKRYAEVGTIYYDERGKIINRSSKSDFQGTSAAFMTPIKANPDVEIIYKEVISFLITGEITSLESDNSSEEDVVKDVKTDTNSEISNNLPEVKKEENIEDPKVVAPVVAKPKRSVHEEKEQPDVKSEDEVVDLSGESWNNIPVIEEHLDIDEKPTVKALSSSTKEYDLNNIDYSIDIQLPKEPEYNLKNERALRNAIFTDGNLYCVQVSSWKTRAYADRELNKLLDEGYNAFIVSVRPKNKRSIWHRVRVGYFETLQEAKSVQRKIGRR